MKEETTYNPTADKDAAMSQEINNSEASLKVDPTVLTKAHPGDIHQSEDSEGMCVEE